MIFRSIFYIFMIYAQLVTGIAILELGFYSSSSCFSSPKLIAMEPLKTSNFQVDSCSKAQASVSCEKQTSYTAISQYLNVTCRESAAFNTSHAYYSRFKNVFGNTSYFAFTAFNDSKCEKVLLGEAIVADGSCVTISNHQSNKAIVTSTSITLKAYQKSQNCTGFSVDTHISAALFDGTLKCGLIDGLFVSSFLKK